MEPQLRERIYSDTLFPALEAEDRIFLHRISNDYRFEFEEIQHLATTARDLEMRREAPLAALWEEWEAVLGESASVSEELERIFTRRRRSNQSR